MSSNDKSTSDSKSSFPEANGQNCSTFSAANGSTCSGTNASTFDPSLRDAVAVVNSYAPVKAAVEAAEGAALTDEEARGVLDALGIQLAPGEDAPTKLKDFANDLTKHRGSSF